MGVTDAELKVLAEAAENPPTIEPPVTEEHHDSPPIELMPTWKLIGALVADLGEAREALKRYGHHEWMCPTEHGYPEEADSNNCSCGLAKALAATEQEEKQNGSV